MGHDPQKAAARDMIYGISEARERREAAAEKENKMGKKSAEDEE